MANQAEDFLREPVQDFRSAVSRPIVNYKQGKSIGYQSLQCLVPFLDDDFDGAFFVIDWNDYD